MNKNIILNLKQREIYLFNDIDSSSIKSVIQDINDIIESDEIAKKSLPKELTFNVLPIKLIINSPGGMIYDYFGLYDFIKSSPIPIHGYAIGICGSAAHGIFLACEKRFCYKTTTFLIHQPSGGVFGEAKDIKDHSERIELEKNIVFNHITENTNISIDQLNDIYEKKKDWFINAEQALGFGIIHEIL